jgi:hypothetical protein
MVGRRYIPIYSTREGHSVGQGNTGERLKSLADSWRKWRLPSADLSAIGAYVTGAEPADRFLATWRRQAPGRRYDPSLIFSYLATATGARLTRCDERILDLCAAGADTETLRWTIGYFGSTGTGGPVAAAWDYLLERGVDEHTIRRAALHVLGNGLGHRRYALAPSWAGESMQVLWEVALSRWPPEQLAAHLAEAHAEHLDHLWDGSLGALATLALRLDPPDVELAWQVAQIPSSYAGYVAGLLLAHDPARFLGWTCALARDPAAAFAAARLGTPGQYAGHVQQIDALRALAQADPARHMPLIEGFIPDVTDGASRRWEDREIVALELAFVADPGRHQARVEAMLGDKAIGNYQWTHILRWLGSLPEEQGQPFREYAVWHGSSHFARVALDARLERTDEATVRFVASLLAHPSKQMRACATSWLAERGEAARAAVTPLLDARKAAARQAAQEVLARLDAQVAAGQLRP